MSHQPGNQRLPYSSVSEFNLWISIKIPLGGENIRPAVPAYRPFRFFYFCLITLAFKCVFCKWGNGPLMHQEWSPWTIQKTHMKKKHTPHCTWHAKLLLSTKPARGLVCSRQQVRSMTTEQREEHSLRPVQWVRLHFFTEVFPFPLSRRWPTRVNGEKVHM